MSNCTNLKPNQRMKIITTGMQIENSGHNVTYAELSKKTNFDRRTCKRYWNRKDLLLTTGTLGVRKKGRSGRSIQFLRISCVVSWLNLLKIMSTISNYRRPYSENHAKISLNSLLSK